MKFKKVLIGLLSLTLTVSSVTFPVSGTSAVLQLTAAAEEEEPLDPDIVYKNCGDHIEITGYLREMKLFNKGNNKVTIPESIEGLPVTKIAPGAFQGMYYLGSVKLPMTLEEIGDSAFEGCFWLGSENFPPSLRRIGNRAFYGCNYGDTLILPDSVEEIGEECFAECSMLHYAILPDSLRTIPRGAFAGAAYMHSVCIPASVERIGEDAFLGCSRLQNVCYKGSADTWAVLSVGSGNECLTQNNLLCDYNKQKVERSGVFDLEKDSWNFLNKEMEYYVLSDESIQEIQSSTFGKGIDKKLREDYQDADYHGACFGFALTSMLAAAGILDPSELDPDATCLHDVKLTDEVRDYITRYYVLQNFTDYLSYPTTLDNTEKTFYYLERNVPLLFIYGGNCTNEEGETATFGHAVVAYGVEEGDYEFNGVVFHKKILTCDSNVNEENGRDGNVYCEPDNPNWKYDELDIDDSLVSMLVDPDLLVYIPYIEERGNALVMLMPPACNLDRLNLHGKNNSIAYTEPEQKCALFRTPELPEGYKLLSFAPDVPATRTDAVYAQGKAGKMQSLQCADGTKGYALEMEKNQAFDCSMSYENYLYTVDSSQVKSASFEPDGAVSLYGEDMQYQLSMIADQNPEGFCELHISGKNADEVSIRRTDGGYLIAGTDLHDVTVDAKIDSTELSLTFSTDAPEVIVQKTGKKKLAVSADLDKNGTYETVLASDAASELGDVNGDGSINAKDAADVLNAAAEIGSGNASVLTVAQQKAADVDGNGTLNAKDAAWILQYAAAIGTGNAPDSLETYVKSHLS